MAGACAPLYGWTTRANRDPRHRSSQGNYKRRQARMGSRYYGIDEAYQLIMNFSTFPKLLWRPGLHDGDGAR